ncbi:MAG: hypothetical protein V4498_00070 [candidate division FCPU426 bacterium]
MTTKIKRLFVLAAVGLLFAAGCSYTINLAAQRQSLDRYVDTVKQAKVEYAQKTAFYKELSAATSTPKQDPYPGLAIDLQAMYRHLQDMDLQQKKIDAYKTRFDAYAVGKTAVKSDDKEELARFKAVQAEYAPLDQAMNADLQAFRRSTQHFASLITQHQIAKVSVAGLKKEISELRTEVDSGVTSMGAKVDEDGKALAFARSAGADASVLAQKQAILQKMEALLPNLRLFQKTFAMSADSLGKNLPTKDFWTGPGMSKYGPLMEDFRNTKAQYGKNKAEFDALSKQFDKVVPPTPTPAPKPSPTAQSK